MSRPVLKAQKRESFGNKVKALRREGILPANIYGKKIKSQAVQVEKKEFTAVFEQAGETNLIDLKIDKEKQARPVLATNLQKHPVTGESLHIDFHQVDLTQKVSVAIPVVIEGESPAVKEKGAVLIILLDEIKVEALPQDLPDQFKVDISLLNNFDDSILVKDLKIDRSKVDVLVEDDESIVMVQEPKEEEIVPPTKEEASTEEQASQTEAGEKEEKTDDKKKDTEEEKASQEKDK